MKVITIYIIFSLWSNLGYAQTPNIQDTGILSNSDQISISYSPADPIATITLRVNKFKSGSHGLEFSLVTQLKKHAPNVQIDSIILVGAGGRLLTLDNPYRDTVYYRKDGSLFLTIIHRLTKAQVESLRQKTIKEIIIVVDSKPVTMVISGKSQEKLRRFASSNLY